MNLARDSRYSFSPAIRKNWQAAMGSNLCESPFVANPDSTSYCTVPNGARPRGRALRRFAVKESCLATSYKSIFFFVIEPTSEIPTWLPETHVRFNFADFTLEQAVGAIKARVQERGGHFKEPMTPSRKVALLRVEEEYQCDRRQINSQEGMQKIQQNLELLFAEIATQLEDVNASGHLNISHQIKVRFGDTEQYCVLGMQRLGMAVVWFQRYANMLGDDAGLIVRELNENAIGPPGHMRLQQPDVLKEEIYDPDISRVREYVWKPRKHKGEMITSKDLASKLVLQFLDLVERDRAGKVKHKGWY